MFWVAVFLGCATFFALTMGGADREFGQAAVGAAYAMAAALVLAFPLSREAAVGAVWRHRWGVGGLAALFAIATLGAGGIGAPGFAQAPFAASNQAWAFVTLALAAVAAAGAADTAGRGRLLTIFLIVPIILALAILADQIDGVGDFFGLVDAPSGAKRGLSGPFRTPEELGAVFALFILLGAFSALDEVRRRPAPGVYGFPPLARRLMLPAGSALTSLNVLAVSGAKGAFLGAVVGILIAWAVMAARSRPGDNRSLPVPAYAAAAGLAATIIIALTPMAFEWVFAAAGDGRPYHYLAETVARASTEKPWLGWGFGAFPYVAANMTSPDSVLSGFPLASGDFAVWRVEAGALGLILGLGALIAFMAPLATHKDRARAPSRGLALGLGVVATCLIAGIGHANLSNTVIAHLAAAMLGLATAFVDDARPLRRGGDGQGMPVNL